MSTRLRERMGGDGCPVDFGRMKGEPHAYIQWKGTDVCTDIHCSCGADLHYDGDFLYAVRCPHCGTAWELEPYVRLLKQEQPCQWHEPKLAYPDCTVCSAGPCEHVSAWQAAGCPWPLPADWPEGDAP